MPRPLDYQEDYLAEAWAAYKNGRTCSLNGSETGTGKTMMYVRLASQVAIDVLERTGKQPTIWLFTVRQDKVQQLGEIETWDLRDLNRRSPKDMYLVEGTDSERTTQLDLVQWLRPKWVVLNYEQGNLHLEQILKLFQRDTDILICNEGDIAQNYASQRSLVTCALATIAHYRIVATATVIHNRIDSLHPLLKILRPTDIESRTMKIGGKMVTFPYPNAAERVGSRMEFLREFAFIDGERITGVRNVPRLQKILSEWYGLFIGTKEMAGIERSENLPEYVELTAEQRALYNGIKHGIIQYVEELEAAWDFMDFASRQEEIQHILVQLNLARRATSLSATHFSRLRVERKLVEVGESLGEKFQLPPISAQALSRGNAKVERVMALVGQYKQDNGGFYIHSEWTDVLDEIEAQLKAAGMWGALGAKRIDGTQGKTEDVRLAVLYGNCRLVLASNSGGRGLNLQKLNRCIFVVPPWSPWTIQQGAGRTERLGQENQTFNHYVLAQDTVDVKKMWQTVTAKERDNQQVLHGGKGMRYKSILDISRPSDIKEWL